MLRRTLLPVLALLATPVTADLRRDADASINAFVQSQMIYDHYTPQDGQALMASGLYNTLLLPDDTPLGDIRALCVSDPNWSTKYQSGQDLRLGFQLQELIEAQ